MRLFEISTMPAGLYRGGKGDLPWWSAEQFQKMLKKSMPTSNGMRYVINRSSEDGSDGKIVALTISLLDPKMQPDKEGRFEPVGELKLFNRPATWLSKAYEVNTITVAEEYRARGMAKLLYWIALNTTKVPLLAGNSQTRGGQYNWSSLYETPGINVRGYGILEDDVFDNLKDDALDKLITAIMESGGEFKGSMTRWGATYHVFMFDVVVDPSRILQNAVKKSKIETYGKGPYPFSFAETGLIATLE
jgi:hypothetical protein